MNRKYISPCISVVDYEMTQELLTASEISVYKNDETYTDDVQLSRCKSDFFSDDEDEL